MSLAAYIIVEHDGSLGPAGDEYVGPFNTMEDARRFQEEHGPGLAVTGWILQTPPEPMTMSPDEYLAYLEKRT